MIAKQMPGPDEQLRNLPIIGPIIAFILHIGRIFGGTNEPEKEPVAESSGAAASTSDSADSQSHSLWHRILQTLKSAVSRLGERIANAWKYVSENPGRVVLGILVASGVTVLGLKAYVGQTPSTPDGILGLEFPGTRAGALAMLSLLEQSHDTASLGVADVASALYWDFGFIASYGVALYYFVRWRQPDKVGYIDRLALRAVWTACLCDVCENLSLLSLLYSPKSHDHLGLLASLTSTFALLKFAFIIFVFVYKGRELTPNLVREEKTS